MNTQSIAIAPPAPGQTPILLRVLFVVAGVAVVLALQAPITIMAAHIIA